MTKYVIVTSPHSGPAYQYPENAHPRDIMASNAFHELISQLNNVNIVTHSFINLDVPRRDCDENRLVCHDDLFRQNVRRYIKYKSNSPNEYMAMLIDVHSFPKHDRSNYLAVNDIYILVDDTHDSASWKAARTIINEFNGTNIRVGAAQGITNDIIDEAQRKDTPAILIEFSESLLPHVLQFICKKLAAAISKLIK